MSLGRWGSAWSRKRDWVTSTPKGLQAAQSICPGLLRTMAVSQHCGKGRLWGVALTSSACLLCYVWAMTWPYRAVLMAHECPSEITLNQARPCERVRLTGEMLHLLVPRHVQAWAWQTRGPGSTRLLCSLRRAPLLALLPAQGQPGCSCALHVGVLAQAWACPHPTCFPPSSKPSLLPG